MATVSAALSTPNLPLRKSAQLSVANPNRNGSGAVVDILTAGANGVRIDKVVIAALGATTDGMVRLYVSGSLIAEVPVTAATPSGTAPAFSAEWNPPGFELPLFTSDKLQASTENGEPFVVTALGWSF
jgi:hypothetical protein